MMRPKLLLPFLLFLTSCLPDPDAINPSDLDRWEYYTEEDGLSQDFVGTIYEDPEGILWFGHASTGGLTRYDGKEFTTFNTADGLLSNAVNCIYYDADSTLLVGTSKGLNFRQKGSDTWQSYQPLLNIPITYIMQDTTSRFWFATAGYGLLFLQDNQLYQSLDGQCADCNIINRITQTSSGAIWFSSYGGVKIYEGNSIKLYTSADYDLPGMALYAMQEDDYGNMWIGSVAGVGISRYHNGEFEKLSLYQRDLQFVTSIAKGKSGDLWIGMIPDGLFHYDGVTMRKVFDGPPSDNILSVLKDKNGAIWVGTSDRGLGKYTPL